MGQFRGVILLFAVSLLFLNCSTAAEFSSLTGTNTATDDDSDSSSGTSSGDTSTTVGNDITSLTFSDSTLTLSLDDVEEDDDVILVLFAENSSTQTVGVQVAESESVFASESHYASHFLSESSYEPSEINLDDDTNDQTHSVHGALRSLEDDIDPSESLIHSEFNGAQYSVNTSVSLGSEEDFFVLSSLSDGSEFTTVTATLVYQTEYFNYYLDNDASDSLDEDDLEELSENFAEVIPLIREMFGEESDVNSDDRFDILSTPHVNGLAGSPNSIVTGYWYANDLSDGANSNQREIIYTMVPDPTGEYGSVVSKSFAVSNIIKGVLPHEFQHMINYNMHVNENGGSTEDSWLNESLSHLVEDIYETNDNDYMLSTGDENPARVDYYLENIDGTCFVCGTNLGQRGGGYLFLRYLYEQAENGEFENLTDGADLITTLLDTNETGIDNIVTAIYGGAGDDEDFFDLMGLYSLAVFLSDKGLTSDSRYNFDGIDLQAVQSDNRSTVLAGPETFEIEDLSFTDALIGNSVIYIQMDGSLIVENDNSMSLSVGSSTDMRGYVLVY